MKTLRALLPMSVIAGVAVLLGTASGCHEDGAESDLLTNPGAAGSGKAPRIYDVGAQTPADTITPTPADTAHYDAVCVDDPEEPQGAAAAAAAAGAPCPAITVHLTLPPWRFSERITGRHIKLGVDASNYYFKGTGEYMRHVSSGWFPSTYEFYNPL